MLTIKAGPRGADTKVLLDGVDISRHLRAVTVSLEVDKPTLAVLEYVGEVDIKGEVENIVAKRAYRKLVEPIGTP